MWLATVFGVCSFVLSFLLLLFCWFLPFSERKITRGEERTDVIIIFQHCHDGYGFVLECFVMEGRAL